MADPALIALQVNDAVLAGRETKNQEADFRRNIGSKHYKPLKTPADIELAKKHGKAKRVYVGKQHDHDEEEVEERKEVCICCGLPLEGEPIALCDELDKLYHLGSGFALYFRFIKYTMSMLVLTMIISGIYNLITNSTNQGCADDTLAPVVLDAAYCVQGYVLSYAIPNKREESDLLMVQAALNLGVVVAIMFFFHYIRYRFRRTEIEADDKTITPSDYTIAIEGLPPQTKNSEIVAWIKTLQTEDMPLIVERIIRPYDINEYLNLTNSYNKLCKHEMSHNNPKGGHEMSESEKKEHEQEMKQIDQRLNELKQEGAIKNCPVAYVTFRTAAQASFVSSKFKKTLFQDMFGCFMAKVKKTDDQINGVRVEVERAPEPTDIQWLNLRFTDNQRAVKRFFTNTTTFVLIALSFGLIILVNWGQNQAIKKYGKGSGVVQGLSIVASVVIAVTNTALTLLIDYLTRYEKHLTNTKFLKGVAQKLAIAQFFNTALTSFFAEMILAEQTDAHDNRLEAMNFYGKGGLLEGIFWVFVTNAIMGPALTIFDSAYFMKLFQQNRVSKQGDKNTLIQKDAQALFEGPTLNMPAKYAAMIKSILLTTFYAPALPIAMVFTIVGLFLSYWADKYVLLKRNSLPLSLDDDLADAMIEIIEWSAFTWAAGNLIYIYSLHAGGEDHHAFPEGARILGWIGLGLSLFHIFFPMEALNEKLFPIKDEVTESETYDHVRLEFNTDYDLEDPNLKRKALNKFVKRINNVKKVAKNMSPASGGSKLFDVVNKASGSPNAKGVSDSPREKRPPGPNDQPVIKEPKLDFRSLDQFANVLKEEEPHTRHSSPAKSARELAKSSPRLEQVPEARDDEAQPRQENPEEVHQETETPFKQPEQVEAHDMKSEEQRFIQPQEVQYQPEVHSNQEEQNHVELAVHQETPVQNQSVHYEEKKTPPVHMEPLPMEEQQIILGDDSFNVKSDECLETPDASRRVFYVNRSLFSKE